jgi:predicted dehydrogenase
MSPIKTAVIGVGVQGRRHAEKLAAPSASQLVYVVDIDSSRAHSVACGLGVDAAQDYRSLIGKVTAVVVATPASTHFEITSTLLESGIHVLLEKPLATTMEDARKLVDLAQSNGLVLQIGHLERFNPVVVALADQVMQPQFIESNRIARYQPRGLDVSVVLDLMMHDIDLIHSFVRSPMEHVDAVGRSVFSNNIDVANARIRFANDCVANVTSSRISLKTERSLRIFQPDSYVSADLQNSVLAIYSKQVDGPVQGPEDVKIDKQSFGESDALMEQARAFLDSVAGGPEPLVSGHTAIESFETASVISDLLGRQRHENSLR